MTPHASASVSQPARDATPARRIRRRLWRWLIEPSPRITEPDQRRQAALLTGFLLGLMLAAVVVEALTGFLFGWAIYTGYRQTAVAVLFLAAVYAISRTRHLQWAATLAVVVVSIAVFASGWLDPKWAVGGLFDFLIVPLWLGSLFIDLKKLLALIGGVLLGLLLFPLAAPAVTLDVVLTGPFSFVLVTSALLLIVTRHRDRLEHDRRAELSAQEQHSRREAARAAALLRSATRLNAQLDLEALLAAVSEEVSRALNTPVAIVTLLDREQNHLYAAAGVGLSPDLIKAVPPLPRAVYDRTVEGRGTVFSLSDLQTVPGLTGLAHVKEVSLRSMAVATMSYEHELIGGLTAASVDEPRDFTEDELLLLQGLADQAALAIVNTRLYKDARRRLEHLQALRVIDIAIATNRNLRQNLEVLLDKITGQLAVDAAVFLLLDETQHQLEYAAGLGFHTPALRFTRLRLGEGMAGRAAQQRRIIHILDVRAEPQTLAEAPSLTEEGFVSYFAAPLIAQGRVKGVLEVFHRSALSPDAEWLGFFEALAGQAAIAIESTALFEGLQRAHDELSQAYDSTIEGWSYALDLRDKETEGHTQRVTRMTLALARAMGLGEGELVHIRRGALLHDIGKMGVPDHILLKPGRLTQEEWAVMRQHTVYAFDLLAPIAYLRPALDIPYCHHEKWDGTGYPRGLSGEQIPFAARLFALVDVWDALRSDRPYRKSWPQEEVREYIRAQAGKHFDPQLVEVFLKLIEELDD